MTRPLVLLDIDDTVSFKGPNDTIVFNDALIDSLAAKDVYFLTSMSLDIPTTLHRIKVINYLKEKG